MSEVTTSAIQELDTVGTAVRQDVRFDERYGLGEHPTRGNCHVFVDEAHAMLSEMPGNHYFAYCYDHALNIGVNEGGLYVLSADTGGFATNETASPEITEFLGEVTNGAIFGGLIRDSVAGFANVPALERSLGGDRLDAIGKQNLWFTKHWFKAAQPAITVMEASFARDAFTNYWQLKKGLGKVAQLEGSRSEPSIDFELIRTSLEALRVRTPQHETRPKYNESLGDFERAVRHLAREAVVSALDLERLVTAYEETLPETNTSANVLFGDCFRYIGKTLGGRRALDEAGKRYDKASRYSRSHRGRRSQLAVRKNNKLLQEAAQLVEVS